MRIVSKLCDLYKNWLKNMSTEDNAYDLWRVRKTLTQV